MRSRLHRKVTLKRMELKVNRGLKRQPTGTVAVFPAAAMVIAVVLIATARAGSNPAVR